MCAASYVRGHGRSDVGLKSYESTASVGGSPSKITVVAPSCVPTARTPSRDLDHVGVEIDRSSDEVK